MGLRGQEPQMILDACARWLTFDRYMPRPADIINLCKTGGLSIEYRAETAWLALQRMKDPQESTKMRKVNIHFGDALDSIGGWAGWKEQEMRWARRDFISAFKASVKNQEATELMEAIHGSPSNLPIGADVAGLIEKTAEKMGVE